MKISTSIFALILTVLISCGDNNDIPDHTSIPLPESAITYPIVEIETRLGTMNFWLFDETPNHKAKFIELAKTEHYNSFTFNRVVLDFVIQGGCPDLPEYFEDSPFLINPEFVDTIGHVYGALGMGRDDNPGKQSNACQFYIVNNEAGVPRLDGDYMIFGEIIYGENVLEKIELEPTNQTNTPLEDIPLKVSIQEYTAEQLLTDFNYSL